MVDAGTRLFCVIGDPIAHSLSPAMHNAVFRALSLNSVYTAFRVPPKDLPKAVEGMRALGFGGANVTIPHKVAILPLLDRLAEEARLIGAVNTVKIDGGLEGHNTDGIGALRALREGGADPRGKRVLILGSGGAARAIVMALALRGGVASLTILGVVEAEVARLMEDVRKGTGVEVSGGLLEEGGLREGIEKAEILIHATPVGMHPKVGESLVEKGLLRPGLVVMDIVYNPLETRLLREAKEAGARTISGLEMFLNQGAESLRIWLGIDAPLELMRKVVLEELK